MNALQKKEQEEKLIIKGSQVIHQNIDVNTLKVIGHCQIRGNLTSRELINKGSTSIQEGRITNVSNVGSVSANLLECQHIDTSGHFQCSGSVTTKKFQAKGTVKINGRLSGEELNLEVGSGSRITYMNSTGNITIKPSRLTILPLKSKRLKVNNIEGGNIKLENVEAKHVVGKSVSIGPNCAIERVIYEENLYIHPKSKVFKLEKL